MGVEPDFEFYQISQPTKLGRAVYPVSFIH